MKPITVQEFDMLYVQGDYHHAGSDKGKWYADFPPESFISTVDGKGRGNYWGWGFGRVGLALIYMFKVTRDIKYLDWLVPQIEYIIAHRDVDMDIESYTGTDLKLPIWSMDGARYGQNYALNVHAALICEPILRFIEVVREHKIAKYYDKITTYLSICHDALAVHNDDAFWVDVDATKGFYRRVPYGDDIPALNWPHGNENSPPFNYTLEYCEVAALYDKMAGTSIYTSRIEKSLEWFKSHLHLDTEFNAYYWAYWPENNESRWEDNSHAQETMSAITLHTELGFDVFSNKDLTRFANTIRKLVDNSSYPPKVRRNIHGGEYLTHEEMVNQYRTHFYEAPSRYAVYIDLGPEILQAVLPVTRYLVDNWDNLPEEVQNSRRLYSVAATIYAQSKVWKSTGSEWVGEDMRFRKPTSFVKVDGEWKKVASKFIR